MTDTSEGGMGLDTAGRERRSARWIAASLSENMRQLEHGPTTYYFLQMIQTVGRFDVKLCEREAEYRPPTTLEMRSSPTYLDPIAETTGLSVMWILTGFQVLDTLGKQLKQRGYAQPLRNEIAKCRLSFLHLRSAFAKAQPFDRQIGHVHPHWGGFIRGSVCWYASPGRGVTRFELSEQLLTTLESVAHFRPSNT